MHVLVVNHGIYVISANFNYRFELPQLRPKLTRWCPGCKPAVVPYAYFSLCEVIRLKFYRYKPIQFSN